MADTQARAAIQAQIKAIMATVATIEPSRIYDGRYATTQPMAFLDRFLVDEANNVPAHIEAWFVARISTPSDTSETQQGRVAIGTEIRRTHIFRIEGYRGFAAGDDHDSENTFQDVIDDLLTAFNTKRTLNNTAFDSVPPQLRIIDFEQFGDLVAHHAQLEIKAYEQIYGLVPQ